MVDLEQRGVDEMPVHYHNYLSAYRLVQNDYLKYRPLIYVNELTLMRQHWMAINSSLTKLPLEITYKPLPVHRFTWMVNLQQSFKMNEDTLGISEKESEEMRGMFVNTNPVGRGATLTLTLTR